jgi:RNA polymerase sigma factor (sigma-70 family)
MSHHITEDDMRWVRTLAQITARRLARSDADDLEGDGMVALVRVAARYDPDHAAGATFRTYAHDRVVGAMVDGHRTWHGGRGKRRLRFESLDKATADMESRAWQTQADMPVVLAASTVDNHDLFELDLSLDGRLTDPVDRLIVSLLTLEELDKQEVARVFQITPGALSHRLTRIRQRAGAYR